MGNQDGRRPRGRDGRFLGTALEVVVRLEGGVLGGGVRQRDGNTVHVCMTAARSHFNPEHVEVDQGDEVVHLDRTTAGEQRDRDDRPAGDRRRRARSRIERRSRECRT